MAQKKRIVHPTIVKSNIGTVGFFHKAHTNQYECTDTHDLRTFVIVSTYILFTKEVRIISYNEDVTTSIVHN